MHPRVVRHLLYPLHERAFRRPTFRLLRALASSQWETVEGLRAFQADKLRRLWVRLATVHADYRQWFESRGIDPLREDPWVVLATRPMLDKTRLRERFARTDRRVRVGGSRRMTTGGSTGEPLAFYVDPMRAAFDKAARMRAHRWYGVEPGDREAYLWGAPIANQRQDRLRNVRDVLLNDRLYSAFDLSGETVGRYVSEMNRFDPVCVFGYPSSLVHFCELAHEQGVRSEWRSLRAVFVTGEVLDEQQRRALEGYFGVPVGDGYGGRDTGSCAHQCPDGNMHLTDEHIVMEVVNDRGEPVSPGESGEIVITNLDNVSTPFIRFRTGDVGRLLNRRCLCGRGLTVMDVVDGRRTDHLVAADGSLRHALSLIYLVREVGEIERFQIHQKRDRSVELRVVARGGIRDGTRVRLLDGFRDCLGSSLTTDLRIVERIAPQASGKFRHVISDAVDVID